MKVKSPVSPCLFFAAARCGICLESMSGVVMYDAEKPSSPPVSQDLAVACLGVAASGGGPADICMGCVADWWANARALPDDPRVGIDILKHRWPTCLNESCTSIMPDVIRCGGSLCRIVAPPRTKSATILDYRLVPSRFSNADEMILRCSGDGCATVFKLQNPRGRTFICHCPVCRSLTPISPVISARYHAARVQHPSFTPAQVIDLLYVSGKVMACPKCGTHYELEGGCNHVLCPACHTEFNIQCGCLWFPRYPGLLGIHSDVWACNACPRLPLPRAPLALLRKRPRVWRACVKGIRLLRVAAIILLHALVALLIAGLTIFAVLGAFWGGQAIYSGWINPPSPPLPRAGSLELFVRDWLPNLDVNWDKCPADDTVCLATQDESMSLRLRAHFCDWAARDRHVLNPRRFPYWTASQDIAANEGRVRWESWFPIVPASPILQTCRRIESD